MIGDKINSKEKHKKAARAIFAYVEHLIAERATFSVAGQSGAGKSEVAYELAQLLETKGLKTMVFQQDDYFFYPPKTNHNRRLDDIAWVGTQEVNLALLDEHIAFFKYSKSRILEKPLVVFDEDRIATEKIDLSPFNIVIAEGTYTTLLQNADHRVFIDRDYFDTLEDRRERGREKIDEFTDRVLKVEDKIISRHKSRANIIVNKDFSVELSLMEGMEE
jgi:uridine kinase